MDKPSTPKYKSYRFIWWYSCTNWNWLLLKSKNIKINRDKIKFKMVVDSPIFFIRPKFKSFSLYAKLLEIAKIPIKGINNNDSRIMYTRVD